jgi:hypothetical protein
MRLLITSLVAVAALAAAGLITNPGLADACAGLIGSNGAVNLGRTTTLAGYHNGEEHYVTAFEFQGGGGEFGTLIPLPAVPSKVQRGGDWTLQRLRLETQTLEERAGLFDALPLAATGGAEVLQEVRIDALDLTVLKGGGPDVAVWAEEHGFRLSPDAPGQALGDGTPVHITMPTDNPWVPLRILGLGKQTEDFIQADVFLLTDERPALLPAPNDGLFLTHDQEANDLLLDDLRSDAGMGWIPYSAWLTKLEVNSSATDLNYDLAIDTTDARSPSRVAAGLELPDAPDLSTFLAAEDDSSTAWIGWIVVGGLIAVVLAFMVATRRAAHDSSRTS